MRTSWGLWSSSPLSSAACTWRKKEPPGKPRAKIQGGHSTEETAAPGPADTTRRKTSRCHPLFPDYFKNIYGTSLFPGQAEGLHRFFDGFQAERINFPALGQIAHGNPPSVSPTGQHGSLLPVGQDNDGTRTGNITGNLRPLWRQLHREERCQVEIPRQLRCRRTSHPCWQDSA